MPDTIHCPTCNQQLRIPESAYGKRVQCPGCKTQFNIPVPSALPPEQPAPVSPPKPFVDDDPPAPARRRRFEEDNDWDEDDDDLRRIRRDDQRVAGDWSGVRGGLTLILAANFTLIGMAVLGVCGGMIAAMAARGGGGPRNPADAPAFVILMMVVGVGYLTMFILTVLGNLRCITAPATAPRVLAIISSAMLVGAVFCFIGMASLAVAGGINFRGRPDPFGSSFTVLILLYLLGLLLGIGHVVIFQVFMRVTASALQARGLATSILAQLLTATISFGLVFAFLMVTTIAQGPGRREPDVSAVFGGCFMMVMGIVCWIWNLVNLFKLRDATK